ncbi:MAG: InlB B-repeat-containing protein [Clostridia bacterium]|nr:InlB B-repeat-containing protein [Clostridia bacterium]
MKIRDFWRRCLTFPVCLLSAGLMLTMTACDSDTGEGTVTDTGTQTISETAETEAPVMETVLYVAVSGDDAAAGTKEAPLATLAGAKARLKEEKPETAVVIFREGSYYFDESLRFNAADCRNVTYRAEDGENVVFTGGVCLTGTWDGTEEINGHTAWVKQIDDLDAYGELNTLYTEDDFLSNARFPDKGSYLYAKAGGQSMDPGNAIFARNLSLITRAGDLPDISGEDLEHARIRIYHYWTEELSPITAYNHASGEITMLHNTSNTVAMGDPYCLENVRCGLDAPGEWFIDYTAKKLYYIPREGDTMDGTKIYAGKQEKLMEFSGAKDITFSGITFAYTNWIFAPLGGQSAYNAQAAVTVAMGKGINFRDCAFRCVGGTCLNFGDYDSQAMDCVVDGCSFEQIGMQAVVIAGANNESDSCKNITVNNCYINGYGNARAHSAGILLTYGSGCTLSHNEITNGSYTAVSVGWSWGYNTHACHENKITDNLIYHIGHAPLSDMGGIYTLGIQTDSFITGNVIYDVEAGKDATSYGGWGIYPDEGSTGFTIENNIVYDCGSQSFHQHYGEENIVRNNIFAFSKEGQVRSTRDEDHIAFRLTGNIIVGDNQCMYEYVGPGRFADDKNLYYDYAAGPGVVYSGDYAKANTPGNRDIAAMQEIGYYKNGVFEDPCFVDYQNRNFGIADMTAAQKIGFTPIDCSGAGSEKFGSKYLLNTLTYAYDAYPTALVDAYLAAQEAYKANRTKETTAAMEKAYNALYAVDAAADSILPSVNVLCSGDKYDAYRKAYDALAASAAAGDAAKIKADTDALKAAYTAMRGESFTLTADPDNGENASTLTLSFGEKIHLPTPAKDGYVLVGWLLDDGTQLSDNVTAGCGTVAVKAQWAKAYALRFDGLDTENTVHGAGMPVGVLPMPEKENGILAGWNTKADGKGTAFDASSLMPDADTTLYPVWSAAAVIYLDDGGKNDIIRNGPKTMTIAAGTAIGTLPVPTRNHYRFLGWNTEKDGSGKPVTDATVFAEGDAYIYSQWAENYVLIFDNEFSMSEAGYNFRSTAGSKGASAPSIDYIAGSITFERTGDDCFLAPGEHRMKLETGHTYRITYTYTIDGEESGHARLTLLPYNKAGEWGADYYIENVAPGAEYTVTDPFIYVALRPGSVADVETVSCYSDIAVQDITAENGVTLAKSAPKNGEKEEWQRGVDVGEAVGTLPTMTCEGYTFVGWNTEKDGSGETFTASTKMPAKDVHLWPVWKKN